jgi:hypothetical protein
MRCWRIDGLAHPYPLHVPSAGFREPPRSLMSEKGCALHVRSRVDGAWFRTPARCGAFGSADFCINGPRRDDCRLRVGGCDESRTFPAGCGYCTFQCWLVTAAALCITRPRKDVGLAPEQGVDRGPPSADGGRASWMLLGDRASETPPDRRTAASGGGRLWPVSAVIVEPPGRPALRRPT